MSAYPATSARDRRARTHVLNETIDRALLAPVPPDPATLAQLLRWQDATRAAERVRSRALRLAKRDAPHRAGILAASDVLVLALYRHPARKGWLYGWCDAAVVRDGVARRAGIGGIVLDEAGKVVARLCAQVDEREPFEAEIAAVQAALRAAAAHPGGPWRICIYSDCDALVSLWLRSRRDPRLRAVRASARRLRRLVLRSVPRRHNPIAHRLARAALSEGSP